MHKKVFLIIAGFCLIVLTSLYYQSKIDKLQGEIKGLNQEHKSIENYNFDIIKEDNTSTTNRLGKEVYVKPSEKKVQPLDTTFCNGKYWNNCPEGQRFDCPPAGDAKCIVVIDSYNTVQDYSTFDGSLSRNKGVVVLSKSGCDYYLVETSLGYSLLEWYGGFLQSENDIIYGNLNSYGFKDITSINDRSGRVYIDDYMLSKSRAIEKYYDKCN